MPPTNTESTSDPKPELIKVPLPRRRRHVPHLLAWLVGGFVGLILLGIALPVFNTVNVRGDATRALMQAKQIGLALKLFAGDNNGVYPRHGVPAETATVPTDANAAFACLFPTYTQSETIFGNKLSVYQTAPPDNVIDSAYTGTPKETLQPGENVYAYVMGLTDADDPHTPLVADGTDGAGFYNTNRLARGGVWKGAQAVVIRLDNSGAYENLTGPSDARFVPDARRAPEANLLDVAHAEPKLRLLNPATGPRRH